MTTLHMLEGAMAGELVFADPDDKTPNEPVLVLGFDEDMDPLCIAADGTVGIRNCWYVKLNWRFVDGDWQPLEDMKPAAGETGEEVPDAGSAEDGPAD